MHGQHKYGYFKEYYSRPEVIERRRKYERIRSKTEKRKEWSRIRRSFAIIFLRDYKKDKSCKKCGWKKHPKILNFHHRNSNEKLFNLSKGNIGFLSREKIIKEINKCDLLCPNCHFWLHYKETSKH